MRRYRSEETDRFVVIECYPCRVNDNHHRPATVLASQWQGGTSDMDPRWVPACDEHFADWFKESDWSDGTIPPEYRLPHFTL